jgi:hypothetical protein
VGNVAGLIIGIIGAVIAVLSLWTARRSARTAGEALAETRRNNRALQAQRARDDVMRVYDDVVRLAGSLSRDLPLSPSRVEPLRENLRRSSQAAGITAHEISELIGARAPLPEARVEEVRNQLLARIDQWNGEIGQRQATKGLLERGSA